MKRTCLERNTTCPDLSGSTHKQTTCDPDSNRDHPAEIQLIERLFDPKGIQYVKSFVRMKLNHYHISVIFIYLLFSCNIVLKPPARYAEEKPPLSDTEAAAGLRQALIVGTDSAVSHLGQTNGYYTDPEVKILLPRETEDMFKYSKKVPGLDKLLSDIELQVNRAAEDAAHYATPVFVNAITSMPIYDVWGILNGDENAATFYLKEKTYDQLYTGYKLQMAKSLKKIIAGKLSAQETWDQITEKWNNFANSFAGKLLEVKPLTVSLDDYVTRQSLYGFFVKIAAEERTIRNDQDARIGDLLKRVFSDKRNSKKNK